MARIRDFAVTEINANAASVDCFMPTHEVDDILLYFANKDGVAAVVDPAGIWTSLPDGVSTGAAYRVGWALATGSAHTLTLTTATTDTWTIIVVAVEGAPTSNPISTSAETSGDDSAMPFDGVGGSTGSDTNCLIFHFLSTDTGLSPTAYPPCTNLYSGDNGTNSGAVAYTFQPAAGAVTAASWYGRANDDTRAVMVAVKDGSSGTKIPPYSDPAISSATVIRPQVGLATYFSDTWPTAVTLTAYGSDFSANSVYLYESAPTWTDRTTEANSATAADITWPMHNTGDAVYFGSSSPFTTLSFITSTAGATGVVVWEYYNGGWVTAPGMSGAFVATGGARVAFTNEKAPTNWATVDPGCGYTKYWVRCRITTSYTVAVVQSQVRLNGYVSAYIVATAAADGGTNPYTDATQNAGASSTANLSGCQINFGAAVDMSSGILMGTIRPVLTRDAAVDIALPSKTPGGIQVTLLDASNYLLSYIVGARGAADLDLGGRSVWAIDWNGSATPWATLGTIVKSAVTKMHLTTLGYYGAAAVQWSMFNKATKLSVAGGSSTYPLDFDDIVFTTNFSFGWFPSIQKSGTAGMIWVPLQFGGGDPVFIECNLNTLQFPTKYDGIDYFAWNAGDNVAGVNFYPKTDDVIKFTNCVFTSPSPYRWEFDASSASSGWTGSFDGTSVIGATVTLRDCFDFDNMSFISCPTFTQNGADITNSYFYGTKVGCSSPANAAKIVDCAFVSSGTGHALEIAGSAADMELHGVDFSGYSGTSTNAPIYVNIGTGTMTISITGGGSTPTIRTAGATVTVTNAVPVSVTALDAADGSEIEGARVLLYATTGTTVTIARSGSTATVTHTTHGYQTGQKVVISGANQGEYNGIKTITYGSADTYTYTVSGTPDTPATGTITSYKCILDGDTGADGVYENASFAFTGTLAVTGRARKATASPLYKNTPLSGTIAAEVGLAITAYLVGDE